MSNPITDQTTDQLADQTTDQLANQTSSIVLSTKRQYDINTHIEKKKNKNDKLVDRKKTIREKKRIAVEKINNINETRTKFYFKLCTDEIYTININAISLIDKFDKIYNSNPFNGTETLPLIIKMNIDNITLNFLLDYIKVWQDIPNECNYPIQSNIQTRIIEQILKEKDLVLFNNYIKSYVKSCSKSYSESCSKSCSKSYSESISSLSSLEVIELKIEALQKLYNIFDVDYLYIPSICAKINAYIATLIWSCSKKEINEYLNKLEQQ